MARTKKEAAEVVAPEVVAPELAEDVQETSAVLVPVQIQRVDNSREEFKKVLEQLSEVLPDELIKTLHQETKSGRKFEIDYLEWFTVADELDRIVGTWSSKIESTKIVGDYFETRVSITVDGVTRENVGIESLSTDSYGDFAVNSFATAFKRAAALFGVGRFLYHRSTPESQPASEKRSDSPRTPARAVVGGTPTTAKRTDGKLEARLLGMKEFKGYDVMEVDVPSLKLKWPINQFFGKQFDYGDLMQAVNYGEKIEKFPFDCLVGNVEKNARGYFEVGAYYPVGNEATSDTAPSSTEPYEPTPADDFDAPPF